MKILELRLKNLNSLYGSWSIDFTVPEYTANGIFALTGPTGAGKSTLLDALCLALYGATPRLGRITQRSNEIMSRQTGECYAEVVFESVTGRFRCHWEQRRARKRADGALQAPEHQIVEADSGRPLETKRSLVSAVIEEKTGMDFDRFTRSVLLAQGGFDTFLRADSEQKSKILEQITGTEIYSAISQKVHDRLRDEREALQVLQAEISGVSLLDEETVAVLVQQQKALQKEENQYQEQLAQTLQILQWFGRMSTIKGELRQLMADDAALQQRHVEFQPLRERLQLALVAGTLDGEYATLVSLRHHLQEDQKALPVLIQQLAVAEKETSEQQKLCERLQKEHRQLLENFQKCLPCFQQVRNIDSVLKEKHRVVAECAGDREKAAVLLAQSNNARVKALEKYQETEKQCAVVAGYCKEHERDAWLIAGLAAVEEQIKVLQGKKEELREKQLAARRLQDEKRLIAEKKVHAAEEIVTAKRNVLKMQERMQSEQRTLCELLDGRVLREYRNEKEAALREMVLLARISELETYREKLESGKPCPLCGALEHPFQMGKIPPSDEMEQKIATLTMRIDRAEALEKNIATLQEQEVALRMQQQEQEKSGALIAQEELVLEKSLQDNEKFIQACQQSVALSTLEIQKQLQPFCGESEKEQWGPSLHDIDVVSMLALLKKRLLFWQEQMKKKEESEKLLALSEGELKRLDSLIQVQESTVQERQQRLEEQSTGYKNLLETRRKLFAEKNPDVEEKLLRQMEKQAEQKMQEGEKRGQELRERLVSKRDVLTALNARIQRAVLECDAGENSFQAAMHGQGFLSESEFLQARLKVEECEKLVRQKKILDDARVEIDAKQKDRRERLQQEEEKQLSDMPQDVVAARSQEQEERLKACRTKLVTVQHRLAEDEAIKKKVKEKQDVLLARKRECERWVRLHELIGSADGKKYRNFAQGLTFELMVSHANRQLVNMTERYLLIRDSEQPLELDVIDNFQAGEIRSTRNLSGGESFLVSLSLALGLSQMASRRVRVDSLFLDEGFGTLDEEALETALETLGNLQQDGKLIGVISHVGALRERIATQIMIRPLSGGKSVLSGPGVLRG